MGRASVLAALLFVASCRAERPRSEAREGVVQLPQPRHSGTLSVEEGIFKRRSVRSYVEGPLSLQDLSQLLWAAGGRTVDGVTGPTRAYPSAGGLYPLEVYVAAGRVKGIEPGVYRYLWREHALELIKEGDVRRKLTKAALMQDAVRIAPLSLVLTAVYGRTTWKYGERGRVRYVHIDAGAAVQNVYLQAEALGLGTVCIGAFKDEEVKEVLGIEEGEPVCIMPVGRK